MLIHLVPWSSSKLLQVVLKPLSKYDRPLAETLCAVCFQCLRKDQQPLKSSGLFGETPAVEKSGRPTKTRTLLLTNVFQHRQTLDFNAEFEKRLVKAWCWKLRVI